jgi:hypothetical protein
VHSRRNKGLKAHSKKKSEGSKALEEEKRAQREFLKEIFII